MRWTGPETHDLSDRRPLRRRFAFVKTASVIGTAGLRAFAGPVFLDRVKVGR
jgi:hypothetical protein